jgi:hypothetical protein
LHNAYRNVVSHVGAILNDFELLENAGTATSWRRNQSDGFRYSISLEGVSSPVAAQYCSYYEQFATIEADIKKKEEEYTKQKAKEMWEEA